jgi:hypothetical protein
MRLRVAGAALCVLVSSGLAQTDAGGARYLSQAELLNQATALLAKARTDPGGMADITLATYPGHSVWMVARTKTGQVEVHRKNADNMVVLDGEATVVTGGTIVDGKDTSPDEVRGNKMDGGVLHVMHKGDTLHIDANVPHQTIVAPGKTISIYIVKSEEPPAGSAR